MKTRKRLISMLLVCILILGVSSIPLTVLAATNPKPPTNLSAVVGSTIKLTWKAPSGGCKGYNIYRNDSFIRYVTSPSCIDSDKLLANTSYKYKVTAYNSPGESSGILLNVLTLPSKPTNLNAPTGNITATSFKLTWKAPSGGCSRYKVTVCQSGKAVFTTTTTNTYCIVPDRKANSVYYCYVTAENASGSSTADFIYDLYTRPNAPPSLTVSKVTQNSIRLDWAVPSGGASRYYIVRDGVQIASGAGTSCTDKNLKPNTAYKYTIYAGNLNGLRSGGITKTVITLK